MMKLILALFLAFSCSVASGQRITGPSQFLVRPGPVTALSIIESAGGALFLFEDGDVFQDRSATPSTAAAVGDPVGTIVGRDGVWFAIAPSDGERATLRETSDGRRYLEGTINADRYLVQDSVGSPLTPAVGAEFTAVFSFWGFNSGTASPLSWGSDSFRNGLYGVTVGDTNNPKVYNSSNGALDLAWYLPLNQNSVYTLKHEDNPALRIDGSNEYPNQETGAVKTDTVGQFAIGTRRNDAASVGAERHYCYALIPSILTDVEIEKIEASLYQYVRQPAVPVSTDLVDLNFASSEFEWGGVSRVLGDLTDNLDGSYLMDYGDWAASGFILSIDFTVPDWSLNSADQRIVRIDRGNSVSDLTKEALFYTGPSDNIHYKVPDIDNAEAAGRKVFGIGTGTGDVQEGLQRATIWRVPGQPVKVQLNGYVWQETDYRALWAQNPSGITVWEDFTSGNVRRVRAKGGNFLQAEADAFHSESDVGEPIHVIGDSFVVFGEGSGLALQRVIGDSDGYAAITFDGVGGADMAAHKVRYEGYTSTRTDNVYTSTLVINDGGWSDSETTTLTSINDMAALLEGHSRYLYVEPWPDDSIPDGNAGRTSWDSEQATLAGSLGSNYVPSVNVALCAHSNTTQDIADVGNRLIPESLSADGVHPSTPAGYTVLASTIRGALARAGYINVTVAVPGAVQNLANASGDVTWDLPTDDGNDPVNEFTVYVEDSVGSGTFTADYSGQLRQYDASGVTAGKKLRVTASNEVGEGTHAEITM